MMRVKWMKKVFVMFLFVFMLCGMKEQAHGASYQKLNLSEEAATVGNVTFSFEYTNWPQTTLYMESNGNKKEVSGVNLSPIILTNGAVTYFHTLNNGVAVVSSVTLDGQVEVVFTDRSSADGFELESYYKNKLYFVRGIDPGTFASYDLKEKKTTVIDKNTTNVIQYKNYFYLTPYCGAYGETTLKVYNASNKKKKTITKKMLSYEICSGKLYCVEASKMQGDLATASVKRYALNGTKKKTLIKKFELKYVRKITKNYIEYVNKKNKTVKKKY